MKWEVFPEAKSIKLKYATEIIYPYVNDNDTLVEMRSAVSDMPWGDGKSFRGVIKMFGLVVNAVS